MNGKTLTQDQWLARHKVKFDKLQLTKQQRVQRYTDYASSNAVVRARTATGAVSLPKQVAAHVAPTARARQYDAERHQLAAAMLDPFRAVSKQGVVPQIPDGEFKQTGTYKFHFNRDVFSDANGRAFVFWGANPFRNHAMSQTTSNVTAGDASFVGQAEFNAYLAYNSRNAAGVGFMPTWTEGSWSVPNVLTEFEGTTSPDIGFQSCEGSDSFFDLAAGWRPVLGGVKFKYSAKALEAQGQVAVARWPGTYGTPSQANQLMVMNDDGARGVLPASFIGTGPNFKTVQALPTGDVLRAIEGFTLVWAPSGPEAQTKWRPTKPKPHIGSATNLGILQYSDYNQTLVYILPDVCNGDPDRYKANLDRVYTTNSMLYGWNNVLTVAPFPIGYNQGTYFQEVSDGSTALQETTNSYAMRDVIKATNTIDMIDDDNGLIVCWEGLEPNTLIGTMEFALGVEYIPDVRTVSSANGPNLQSLKSAKTAQLDNHSNALRVLSAAPAALPGDKGGHDFLSSVVDGVESVASAVPRVAAAISQSVPYVQGLMEAFGMFV